MNIEFSVGRVPIPDEERASAKGLLEAHAHIAEVMQFESASDVGNWVRDEFEIQPNISTSLQRALLAEAVAMWNRAKSESGQ